MAIRNFLGFEAQASVESVAASLGNVSYSTSFVHSGDVSLKVSHPGGGANGGLRVGILHDADGSFGVTALDTHYGCIFFAISAIPTSTLNILYLTTSANSLLQRIGINSDGFITIQGAASATTTLKVHPNSMYRLEWFQNGNGGNTTLRLNGVEDAVNVVAASAGSIARIIVGNAGYGGSALDIYYDDLVIDDAGWVFDTYGDVSIFRLDPDGAGAVTAWTGAYTDVDETPHDTDTTYLTSSTSGQAETVQCETLANATGSSGFATAAGADILAVKTNAIVRDEGGASAIQVRLTADGVSDDTTSNDPGSTYVARCKIYTQTPNATAWTEALLNAAEVGVDNAANVAVRCTSLYLSVLVGTSLTKIAPIATTALALGGSGTYSGDYGKSYTGAGTALTLQGGSEYSFVPVDPRYILREGTPGPVKL